MGRSATELLLVLLSKSEYARKHLLFVGKLVNREKFSHKVCVYAIFSLTL